MGVTSIERTMTCPYCRFNGIPIREESKTETRIKCRKCKLTLVVEKKSKYDWVIR